MKISRPSVHVFICPLCQQAQSVHFFKGEYTISDKHCEYSVKFTEPRLVKFSPMIASHRGQEGFWQCPLRKNSYRLQAIEGGFVVRDGQCGVQLTISSGSPLLRGTSRQ